MGMTRRSALKSLAGAAAAATGLAAVAEGREARKSSEEDLGMLYDATRCIGCKACVVACKQANGMPLESSLRNDEFPGELYDAPRDLTGKTRNIIKLAKSDHGQSFMKMQCMHCVDPACISACMIQALHKGPGGVVEYDPSRCVGCRYCQIACPFNVPKFQWDSATPQIVKCELCRHRFAEGKGPACCEVCPREAVIFGKRQELLAEAKARLAAHPDRYEPKVYGEHDGGGTQVLYLSARGISFQDLGLPDLRDEPVPTLSETVQHGIYQGFIAPAALYAVLGGVLLRNRRKNRHLRVAPSKRGKGGEA